MINDKLNIRDGTRTYLISFSFISGQVPGTIPTLSDFRKSKFSISIFHFFILQICVFDSVLDF